MMNNYDEIAKEAVKNVTGFPVNSGANILNYNNAPLYECAYEAAKLQAENFNKEIDKLFYRDED